MTSLAAIALLSLLCAAPAPAQWSVPMVLAQDPPSQTGQSSQPTQSTPSGDPGTISGTVLSAATGEPLAQAHLTLTRMGAVSRGTPRAVRIGAITDASGNFQFTHVDPGNYGLMVERRGYVTDVYGETRPNSSAQMLDLPSGGTLSKIIIRLVHTGVITGHVTDENGQPLERAQIQVVRKLYSHGELQVSVVGNDSTNDLGQYRVFDLSPGRYYVRASYSDNRGFIGAGTVVAFSNGSVNIVAPLGGSGSSSSDYPTEYYPGVAGITHATPIIVKAGDEVPGMDIALSPVQTHSIRGRVVGAEDCGRGGGTVFLTASGDDGDQSTRDFGRVNRQDGSFEIDDVAPGSYFIGFPCGNGRPVLQQSVNVGNADVDGVSLAVTPGANISVAVKLEGQGTAAATNMQVRLAVKNPMLGNRPSAEVQSDGSFLFTQVGDGTYSINVTSACRTCYLKSATAGSVDVLQDGVQVSSGTGPSSIQIVYSSDTGTVTGTVTTDGDTPAANARVVLVPDAPFRHSDRYRTGFTDSTGKYQLQGVPPGHYEAFAWEAIDAGADEDPDIIQSFENQSGSVEVDANETKTADLKLIPASATGASQ